MTYDDMQEDCKKFLEYLKANGKRSIAFSIHVCDDHENTDGVFAIGNQDQLREMAVRLEAARLGFKVVL